MLLQRDTAKLLGSIAFLAMWEGRFAESEAIFHALREDAPDRVGPPMGLALSLMHQGRFGAAVTRLEADVLPLSPQDPHARCWYGLALYMDKQYTRSRDVLKQVADEKTVPDAADLARSLLLEMDEKGV